MAIRIKTFEKEEFYHIYNRGNSKQIIFHDDEDKILILSNRHATVIGHTPHVGGVQARILSSTESRCTSPTSFPSIKSTPASMII